MTGVRSPLRSLGVALLLALTLGACGGSDGGEDATETPAPSATAAGTPTPVGISGALASDGICQVTIPDAWSDDGTARGLTSTNARWTLFGNLLADDAEWLTAVELLKTQQGGRPGATVDEQPDRVTVTQAENRGTVVRRRFPDRYCELSVTGTGVVPDETAALWISVADGLAPVAP